MSFKFERDTYKHSEGGVHGVADAAMSAAADARDQLLGRNPPLPGTTGKHPISETIGTALTGGKKNAGTKGYLAVRPLSRLVRGVVLRAAHQMMILTRCQQALTLREDVTNSTLMMQAYIKQLEDNPMRTKMLTAGTLSGAQELIASWLAKDRNNNGHYFTSRVPKMAAYGAFVSAPLGSLMIWMLQKIFKGRTSLRAKILQILVSNLIVCLGFIWEFSKRSTR